MIAGIDFSTKAVDVVLLDEDTDAATWHRFELHGDGAFDRARDVDRAFNFTSDIWDEVVAIGIEEPMMRGGGMSSAYSLYRVQGAILAKLPWNRLVHPIKPSSWRKTVGLKGNATKDEVAAWVNSRRAFPGWDGSLRVDHPPAGWPQDACDAYCIALATRTLLQRDEAA